MRFIRFALLATTTLSCATPEWFRCVDASRRPEGTTADQCESDLRDNRKATCYNKWRKYNSYEMCIAYHTDPATKTCFDKHGETQESFDECYAIETNPEEKFCRNNSRKFKDRDECGYAFNNPLEFKCKKESKEMNVPYYDCMRFYSERDEARRAERNRMIDRDIDDMRYQRQLDRESNQNFMNAMQQFNKAAGTITPPPPSEPHQFVPPPQPKKTNCTTRREGFSDNVITNCTTDP